VLLRIESCVGRNDLKTRPVQSGLTSAPETTLTTSQTSNVLILTRKDQNRLLLKLFSLKRGVLIDPLCKVGVKILRVL